MRSHAKITALQPCAFPARPPQLPIRYLLEEECIKEGKQAPHNLIFFHDPAMLLPHGRFCKKTAARGLKETSPRSSGSGRFRCLLCNHISLALRPPYLLCNCSSLALCLRALFRSSAKHTGS